MEYTKEKACMVFNPWTLRYYFCVGSSIGLLLIVIGTENIFGGYLHPGQSLFGYGKKSFFNQTKESNKTNKNFKMLWYAPPSWLSETSGTHKIEGCELDNCDIVINKSELINSDIVLFHHAEMDTSPPAKGSNQTWVFASWEAPYYTRIRYMSIPWKDQFDWTMSYRSDAEGYGPYGKIVPVTVTKKQNYTAIFLQKQKDVAWVVSHCNTLSKRETYVEKMKKFINVDVFGRCGTPCVGDCFQKIKEQYKFYLSFENSICKDYVTEKLFRIFKDGFDIVPVVRGAPNVKNLLPNNTYISTLDFDSPEVLAKHLKKLGSNEATYTDILIEKHKFASNTLGIYALGLCSLCKRLNNNFKRKEKLKLKKVMNHDQCKEPNDF